MSKVAVIGIGRVGLPLALYLADHGHEVTGVDVNAELVESVAAGRMPFHEAGHHHLVGEPCVKLIRAPALKFGK